MTDENARICGTVGWTWEDVQTLRANWTPEQCQDALDDVEEQLRERVTELGWEVLDTLLRMRPMRKQLNPDQAARDAIIFGAESPLKYSGGIEHYEGLSLEQLERLIAQQFVDVAERQNESPTIFQFLAFMQTYPKTTAHGYVVSREREDYRVSIEGLACTDRKTLAQPGAFRQAFRRLCGDADEFTLTTKRAYCWYD